jgi:hypothetical protein
MRASRAIAILLACVAALAVGAPRPSRVLGASGSRVEVRQLEMACYPGKPGVRIRLTLATGQAVEYRADDPVEIETIQRLGAMFVAGGTRMFADVDGSTVLSVQVAGPFGFRPGQ